MTSIRRPRVSVILIVRNGEQVIGPQLQALAEQEGAPAFEVLVVDNGSTDGTADVVRRWIDGQPSAPCGARLVDASAKRGIPYARNCGAKASRGEVLAFCDADDVVAPNWVAAISSGLVSTGMVGGRTVAMSPSGEPRPDVSVSGLLPTRYLPYAPGANFAVTRDCYFGAGGFDESLPPYGFDDVDFSFRVQDKGYRLTHLPDAVVRFSVTGNVGSVRKVFLLAKGRLVMIRRHPEFADREYSLASCATEAATSAVYLPIRLIRPRGSRAREVRWFVSSVGRLSGYWLYVSRGKDQGPQLVGPDPLEGGSGYDAPVIAPEALDGIEGWFADVDQGMFRVLLAESAKAGGDLAELGVYLGKSAILMGEFVGRDEVFTVVDLFGSSAEDPDNQIENDGSYSDLSRAAFERNYLAFHEQLPVVIQGPSNSVVDHARAGSHRFVHVDASHLYEHVAADIMAAKELLKPQGILVLDDYRSQHTPGVAAAGWQAVVQTGLHVIGLSPNKMYATWGDPDPWQKILREWAGTAGFRCEAQVVNGHELLLVRPIPEPSLRATLRRYLPASARPAVRRARRQIGRVRGRLRQ